MVPAKRPAAEAADLLKKLRRFTIIILYYQIISGTHLFNTANTKGVTRFAAIIIPDLDLQ